ncbi:MAG: hypothetical protein PVSMB8_15580 [Vulcanimicrobiaceae bacterium]
MPRQRHERQRVVQAFAPVGDRPQDQREHGLADHLTDAHINAVRNEQIGGTVHFNAQVQIQNGDIRNAPRK